MKHFIVILIILVSSVRAYSEDNTIIINGSITDILTNSGIESVLITVKEQNLNTLTNETGLFSIKVLKSPAYTIRINRFGYHSTEICLITGNEDKPVNLSLYPVLRESPAIIVTGRAHQTKFHDMLEKGNLLEGAELHNELGQTLAATLQNETGISIRSMGPAPARPVIRGLGGDRILISEDNIKTNDLSSTSPDHAVALDPFSAESIEIIRGPRVLMNTGTTIGGVVNIIRNDISRELPDNSEFETNLNYESVNQGRSAGVKGRMPLLGMFLVKGDASYRKAGDIYTPFGTLSNTGLESTNYDIATSYSDNNIAAGIYSREFISDYGIPGGFVGAHPNGVNIEMLKRVFGSKAIFDPEIKLINDIELNYSRTYYKHTEYEASGLIGAEFVFRDHMADLMIDHGRISIFEEGKIGLDYSYRDTKYGGYVFTPQSRSYDFAAYIYEEIHLSNLLLQSGIRYSRKVHSPEIEKESNIGLIRQREFDLFSASVSGISEFTDNIYGGLNVSLSSRAPTLEELYSEGPHLAAYSYETGNPDLEKEYGFGNEIFAYYKSDRLYTMLTAYLYEMPYYIIPRNTGDTNYAQQLPIYATSGESARIYGFEGQMTYNFTDNLSLNSNISYTNGELTEYKSPLPMIPPLKGIIELKYGHGIVDATLRSEWASSQTRLDKFEEMTKGYIVFAFNLNFRFETGDYIHMINLRGDNLFNAEYQNHLSRIKSIVPEPGINLRIGYRLLF